MNDPVIVIEHLSVHYEKASVLWDIDLRIPPGGILVAIVGPNGAGKSTLLKTMLGLVRPASGCVRFFGESIEKVRSRVAYIPQREEVDWEFPITVFEVVLMGCLGRLGLLRRPGRQEKERALALLERVGMRAFASRQIGQLSGGQQQRVFIARALMQQGDIYLMDEPLAGIDAVTEQEIFALLSSLREEGKTVVAVHHDLATVDRYFNWAIVLNTCLIAAGPVQEVMNAEMMMRAYGRMPTLLHEAARRTQQLQSGIR